MLLAQITDTHIVESGKTHFLDNNALLAAAVDSVNNEDPQPDLVVGSGDLTNAARPAQYEVLASLIAELDVPFLPLAGNHDDRSLLKSTFPNVPWTDAEHASWVHLADGTRIVGLDSIDPGNHGGAFDDERKTWLDAALSGDQPTVLVMHHPPFDSGIKWMDKFGFERVHELHEVIEHHAPKILRILCGHVHRPVITTVAGVTASICPATVHHVALDLKPTSEPAIITDPRGYQLHAVSDKTVVTHTRYIDRDDAPFDPGWD